MSPPKFSTKDSGSDGFFLNVIPPSTQEDGHTMGFQNFTPSLCPDKPSKPSRSSVELMESFKEIKVRDFTKEGRARSKTRCSIDVGNNHGKLRSEKEYVGCSSSQLGSTSKKTRDVCKVSQGENKVSRFSQLKRSQSVLTEELDSNYRQTDIFGTKMSSFVPRTLTGNPMEGTSCVEEESAEHLRSQSKGDGPRFGGSPELGSPGKITGPESGNFSTEFIYTGELTGPPTLKTKLYIGTEDTDHSREIIVDSRPKKRSVNSDTMMLGKTFKKMGTNDLYFSQNNDTPPSRQFTIFPTPSWETFGSNPNNSSKGSHFCSVPYKKTPATFGSTPGLTTLTKKRHADILNQAALLVNSNPAW